MEVKIDGKPLAATTTGPSAVKPAVAPQSAGTGRSQYITKLPSSALLTHSVTDAFGRYASVAALRVKQGFNDKVLAKIVNGAKHLPTDIAWQLVRYQDDGAFYMLTESARKYSTEPGTPKTTSHTPGSAEITPKTTDTPAKDQDGTASGILTCGKDDNFAKLLSTLNGMLDTPATSSRRHILLDPPSSLLLAKNTIIEAEKFKIKSGQENEIVQIAKDVFTSFIPQDLREDVGIEVQQDMSDLRLFVVLYHFTSAKAYRDIHFTDGWKNWRRSLAPLLDGQSLRNKFIGVYHSSQGSDLTVTDAERSSVPTPLEKKKIEALKISDESEVADDPLLKPFAEQLAEILESYLSRKKELSTAVEGHNAGSLLTFSKAYRSFGLRRVTNYGPSKGTGWLYRDWLPNAKEVSLKGDFNSWSTESHRLTQEDVSQWGEGVWSIFVADKAAGNPLLTHRSTYKLHIETKEGAVVDRVPPWVNYAIKQKDAATYDGVVWNPVKSFQFENPRPKKPKSLRIYEAHVGICTPFERVSTYNDMRTTVLPRVARLGYNALLLIGVQEHNYYPSMGWHVTSFFAATSRCGDPYDFMRLVDAAHGLGISVLVSLVHSHASPAVCDGLAELDGPESAGCYFRQDETGHHSEWDAKIFDFENLNVLRFLLGNLTAWIEDFGVDGFRFEGVTSMLYKHHGIGKVWTVDEMWDYGTYFNYDLDEHAIRYLMLANDLVHSMLPATAITIANETSSLPTLCMSLSKGGLGFDFRARQDQAAAWIQYTLEGDEDVSLKKLVNIMESRRPLERTVGCAENYDTCTLAKRPMKIAMFAWESLLTHAVGGVAPHVTELAAALSRLGHEVHVYVRATGSTTVHSVHYGVHYHECTFDLVRDFPGEMANMCRSFVANMYQTEAFMRERFHICHAHDWLAAKAAIECSQDGHTVIQTIHSTEYGRCGNVAFGGESQRIRDIEASACGAAGRVICVSGVLAEEVSSLYGVHPAKLRVIYNGINANQFDGLEDSATVKGRYGITAMEPFFLFVGRMAIQKGPDLLIEAIPYILQSRGDAKFVLVGDGHMLEGLKARVQQLGIGHACRLIGALGGPPLKSLFKACDAVVIPSRNEPFGIVVLEAWSAHKPVVATTCGGPRDFVSPDVDGYLVDPTPSSISWGCCKILENFDHARWMGSRGRVKAAFSFSWDRIGNQTRDLYFEQLAKNDAAYGMAARGDSTLSSRLLCGSIFEHMTIFDEDAQVARGLALHKMMRLTTCGLGSDAYSNVMGNEFGQPEFIDLPRTCNNFSYHHARTRWDLADDTQLKFKHFQLFDACMVQWEESLHWLASRAQYVSTCSDEDKVLAFERGPCLFVFNFHPHTSFEGYQIGHSLKASDLRVFLDTDEGQFGGFGRVSHEPFPNIGKPHAGREDSIKIYIPCRTGMVIASEKLLSSVQKPPVGLLTADDFISLMEPHVHKPTF